MKVNHIGVPVSKPVPNEEYVAEMKVHLTHPEEHPFLFEYLRFDADAPQPEELRKMIHIAYECPNLEEAIKGADKIVIEPFQRLENLRLAFIIKDGILMELMEFS